MVILSTARWVLHEDERGALHVVVVNDLLIAGGQ